VVYPPTGSTATKREMSTPPTLQTGAWSTLSLSNKQLAYFKDHRGEQQLKGETRIGQSDEISAFVVIA